MYRHLIINVSEPETRVALLENGILVEFFIERNKHSDITGNIYKGKIEKILPGMQSAFVNIGLEQSALIHTDDINLGIRDLESDKTIHNSELKTPDRKNITPKPETGIAELIREGEEILVQVAKSPLGKKGARLTTSPSIPGHFLVLTSDDNHIGISRKIENEAERIRLKNLLLPFKKDNIGYIVRTAAQGSEEKKLIEEINFLNTLWENIQAKFKKVSAPFLLHKELSLSFKAVRDFLTHKEDRIIIDSPAAYEEIILFSETFMPGLKGCVELYERPEPIFDTYHLEADIEHALKRKIWLKSGGYIIIEHTEALVVIDVNTGKYVGKHNLEETVLKTNLEAVKEIAYQIRLRDISGIIVIDFIDMENFFNREKVFNALKESLKKDRSKTHILPVSEMGLIEMTRKRVKKSLNRMLTEPCFYCEGKGHLMSRQAVCYKIYREILNQSKDMTGFEFTVKVHPEIARLFHGEENHLLISLENILKKKIIINSAPEFHIEKFDIIETLKK